MCEVIDFMSFFQRHDHVYGGHPNDRKVTFGGVNTRSGSWGSDRNKDTMQGNRCLCNGVKDHALSTQISCDTQLLVRRYQ
uniref:Uncharacterized protein n=1 Tax=Magallana gigas TaxID=29159 RepID=K1QLZ4_MAGGI